MKIRSFSVSNHPVLGEFNFNLNDGTGLRNFNLLIGINGCGKTQIMDTLYDFLEHGFQPWNDSITRTLSVDFTPEEISELGVTYSDIRFEHDGNLPNNWDAIKVFRISDNVDITRDLFTLIQNSTIRTIFRRSCRYSPVEINFANKKIDSVKASTLDDEEVKTKSTGELASVISQLLVDIYNQDAQEALVREQANAGKGIEYAVHEGKYDRFKNAYAKMFAGKELWNVTPDNGQHKVLFRDIAANVTFDIDGLSSGEKQVVYRAGYLLSNLNNINSGVVFIDEPELSLHPAWQQKYLDFLLEIFSHDGQCAIQFVIATHSPYVIKGADLSKTFIWQFKRDGVTVTVDNIEKTWSALPVGPTLGEVTYQAFGLPNIEFHCDLYGALQTLKAPGKLENIEAWFLSEGQTKEISWLDSSKGISRDETLMTYVRNRIHHPDNGDRPEFSNQQLEESIKRMLTLI
jgi:energy-coupling factor transporter ATP-binding protein EcfA2